MVPDFLEGSIAGLVEDYIVEAIKDVVVDEIVPSAEELLSGFAIGTTFDDASLEMVDQVLDTLVHHHDAGAVEPGSDREREPNY